MWNFKFKLADRRGIVKLQFLAVTRKRIVRLWLQAIGDSGKNIGGGGLGPLTFGRQQRLSEITTEPYSNQ